VSGFVNSGLIFFPGSDCGWADRMEGINPSFSGGMGTHKEAWLLESDCQVSVPLSGSTLFFRFVPRLGPSRLQTRAEGDSRRTPFMKSSSPSQDGFLFATFKGEMNPLTEQVYLALSSKGRDWTALNGGEPVLVSERGEQGARDPFLVRSPDSSNYWCLATDLSIHRNPDWNRAVTGGSRSILIWESSNLVNWGKPRLVEIAAPDAGCAWAPEAIWDAARERFLVFWASTNAHDNFSKQRIWAATTRDFHQFSEPFVWIDKPHPVIDTDVVREGDTYFRFSKDEEIKSVTLERSSDLLGEWRSAPDFSLGEVRGVEGPLCFPLGDGVWCLLLDFFASHQGYKAFVSRDLAGGEWEAADDFSFPFLLRHGGVLPISAHEVAILGTSF
jgi:hypothetical protein